MFTDYEIYTQFRKAQSLAKGKPFRLPSDWDTFKNKRISVVNVTHLDRATGYFNTTWSNIDPLTYMQCGFELYKTFTYHMFLKPQIISLYIEKDKQKKRRIKINKESLLESIGFIRDTVGSKELNGYSKLQIYCKMMDGDQRVIINHYLHNNIDPLLFVYCIYYKYIKMNDNDRILCYNIINRYRELLPLMFEVEDLIKSKENL